MINFIYGFHAVSGLVWQNPGAIDVIYMALNRNDKRVNELLAIAKEHAIAVESVSNSKLDKMCSSVKHQGVAVQLKDELGKNSINLKVLLTKLALNASSTIVVLDGITDPHNLGAIIRSCECFGVDAVIIPKDNSANINATVAKVSSGAISHIPVIVVNNLSRSLDEIKEFGYWIAGTALSDSSVSLFDFKPDKKMVWVMGNEGTGIRRLVLESCDYTVSIPMYGNTNSLNVSVATGIVLSYAKYMGRS